MHAKRMEVHVCTCMHVQQGDLGSNSSIEKGGLGAQPQLLRDFQYSTETLQIALFYAKI